MINGLDKELDPDISVLTIRNKFGLLVTVKKDVYKWITRLPRWTSSRTAPFYQDHNEELHYAIPEVTTSMLNLTSASEEILGENKKKRYEKRNEIDNVSDGGIVVTIDSVRKKEDKGWGDKTSIKYDPRFHVVHPSKKQKSRYQKQTGNYVDYLKTIKKVKSEGVY